MKLSVIATLYQSAPYIHEFHRRATAAASALAGDDYEIVLVNDGSPDNSLELALALVDRDPHITVIDLSRNFGHHKAMMTGLAESRGDLVYLIDSDLEEKPEWLDQFHRAFMEKPCDMVYGVQHIRKGGIAEKVTGHIFYWLIGLLTGMDIPRNVVTARLMSRRYVESLVAHREREIFIGGLWHITGFRQEPLPVSKLAGSETTYSLRKKLGILVNSVTSFSNVPLRAIFYLGVSISLLAIIYVVYVVIQWLMIEEPVSGWASLIASIWLLGGITLSCLGVIGIYLAKIFSETKHRPYTIIREVYGRNDS